MNFSKRNYKAFSTVETLISAVILSVVMFIVFGAIGKTMDQERTLIITKGISTIESWRYMADSLGYKIEPEQMKFDGGIVDVQVENKNNGRVMINFSILDPKRTKIISWTELHIAS